MLLNIELSDLLGTMRPDIDVRQRRGVRTVSSSSYTVGVTDERGEGERPTIARMYSNKSLGTGGTALLRVEELEGRRPPERARESLCLMLRRDRTEPALEQPLSVPS